MHSNQSVDWLRELFTDLSSSLGSDLLFLSLLVLFFRFLSFFEIQDHTVDTITQAGGWGAIVEYMSEVGLAAAALGFGAHHAMGIIRGIDDTGLADGLIKTGPAATAVEFGIAFKERVATGGTVISAHFLKVFKLAGPGSFRSFHPGDIVHIGREYLLPFCLAHVHLAGIRMGINGVAIFFGGIIAAGIHIAFFKVGGVVLGIAALLKKAAEGQEQEHFADVGDHIHITNLRNGGSGGLSGGRQPLFFNISCFGHPEKAGKKGKIYKPRTLYLFTHQDQA